MLATGVYGLILLKNALDYASELLLAHEASAATQRLRRELFARYLAADKRYLDTTSTSAMRDALMNAATAPAAMATLFHRVLTKTISCLIVVAYLVRMSWLLATLALVLAPCANLAIAAIIRRIRASATAYTAARSSFGRTVHEQLAGMVQIHAASAERREADRLDAAGDVERSPCAAPLAIRAAARAGARARRDHHAARDRSKRRPSSAPGYRPPSCSVRVPGAAADAASRSPCDQATRASRSPRARRSWARLDGPLSVRRSSRERRANTCDGFRCARSSCADLAFGWRAEGAPVLRGVSFALAAGTTTLLVGASGSGKTTLLQLLFGFYDTPAGVSIDGVDLRELDRASWRRRLAYVTQDAFVFDASLRDNLTRDDAGRGVRRWSESVVSLSDAAAELVALLRRLALGGFLDRLPDGLDSALGERGCRMSGGEKQRLALARAILRDADVFLLDEVTSALAAAPARAVAAALRELLAGKTVVIASHRPALLGAVDQVIELHKGFLVSSQPARAAAE